MCSKTTFMHTHTHAFPTCAPRLSGYRHLQNGNLYCFITEYLVSHGHLLQYALHHVLHILEIQEVSYVSQYVHVAHTVCSLPAPSVFVHTFSPHTIFTGRKWEWDWKRKPLSSVLSLCQRKGKGGWGLRLVWEVHHPRLPSYQESLLWCTYNVENVSSGRF